MTVCDKCNRRIFKPVQNPVVCHYPMSTEPYAFTVELCHECNNLLNDIVCCSVVAWIKEGKKV